MSYDLNFRPSLWASSGGRDRAIAVNRELAQFVDVLFGNEEDFTSALGFEMRGFDVDRSDLDTSAFEDMVYRLTSDYPNVKVVATSIRRVLSASRNDWGAICWADGCFYRTATRDGLEILDRVGGGDGFAAGMIFGLLGGRHVDEALELGGRPWRARDDDLWRRLNGYAPGSRTACRRRQRQDCPLTSLSGQDPLLCRRADR